MHKLGPGEIQKALDDYAVRTHDEVANILGVSRQAIQQMERRILMKARRHPRILQYYNEMNGRIV